jgi:hypothetical protein
MLVHAEPIRADGRVAGRWSRRDRLRFGQDALSRSHAIENHSIELGVKVGDLQPEIVDGVVVVADEVFDSVELDDEICDRRIDSLLPRRDLLHLFLDGVEAVPNRVDALLETGEALVQTVAELLHLLEQELGSGIHGPVELLLVACIMGILVIQTRIQHRFRSSWEI